MALRDRDAGAWVPVAVCAGFLLRMSFAVFLAGPFWGRPDYRVDADTRAWVVAFDSLWETGTFTAAPGTEYGYFGRMPAYSLFIGAFYLLSGKDWSSALTLVSWTQVLLDSIAIYFAFAIASAVFGDRRTAAIVGLLYATYPFVIVWAPVAYSESLAVFLMLGGSYAFVAAGSWPGLVGAGVLLGLGALNRPQLLLLAPILALTAMRRGPGWRARLTAATAFTLGFALAYAPWPLRNYFNHGKLVLTQDLSGFPTWSPDVIAFMQYIHSVKAEWEPQFSQILRNETVDFPPAAHRVPGDDEKLTKAVALAKTCGSGFSHWPGYWKERFRAPNCNDEIARLFTELRRSQIEHNAWNFWVDVPLQNLWKAVFKRHLYDRGTPLRRLAELAFLYRSLLIVAGVVGAIHFVRAGHDRQGFVFAVLAFFVCLYLALCTGTAPQMRNIEMRYLLPADVLLIIPAGYLLGQGLRRRTVVRVDASAA